MKIRVPLNILSLNAPVHFRPKFHKHIDQDNCWLLFASGTFLMYSYLHLLRQPMFRDFLIKPRKRMTCNFMFKIYTGNKYDMEDACSSIENILFVYLMR